MQPVPTLYHPDDVFADAYAPRIAQFASEGQHAGLRPASKDKRKVALLEIDNQWDFIHPTGTLAVAGAQADTGRLINFLYKNAEEITSIYASLDSHFDIMIFFSTWWRYQDDGSHPAPFTIISLNNKGEAVDHDGRVLLPQVDPLWSMTYLKKLAEQGDEALVIWPYHTMVGSLGHMMMPALSEAHAFYSAARRSQINFLFKGMIPQSENYGIFGPEVTYPNHPMGGLNTQILDVVAGHDLIYVAGQAKTHCVLKSAKQMVRYFKNQPDVIAKMRFMRDCTSPVLHPQVDFNAIADAELAKMEQLGVVFVNSTDPIG